MRLYIHMLHWKHLLTRFAECDVGEKMDLLSVVVPIYNEEKYLKKCLDSICRQTFSNIEIILVDDGSTDSSGMICDEYAGKDNRITVLHRENEGKIVARLSGIEAAKGRYISFVDSDDWIDEDLYAFFEKQMREDIDIILYGKQVETDKSGVTLPLSAYEEGYYDEERIKKTIWTNMLWDKEYGQSALPHSLCDKIFKKDLLLQSFNLIEEKQNLNLGEDAMIVFPLMQWVKTAYISNRCFYHYRKILRKVPQYVADDKYFDNLYNWYSYLRRNITEIETIEEQLEYIYTDLMKARREKWGDFVQNDSYLFPFDKVSAKSRIVLYGAGRVGATYYSQIKRIDYCDVAAWVDKNYEAYASDKVTSPDGIFQCQFDYIVVAVESPVIQQAIVSWLCSKADVEHKIVL